MWQFEQESDAPKGQVFNACFTLGGNILKNVHGIGNRALNVFFGLFVSFFCLFLDLLLCFLFPVLLSTDCIPHVKCSFPQNPATLMFHQCTWGESGRSNIYFINSSIWTMEIRLRASCLPAKCSTISGKTELPRGINHL